MKIIVRLPNWIGDTVLALPALRSLRAAYPEAEIWLAAHPWIKELFDSFSLIQGCFPIPDKSNLRKLKETSALIKQQCFDLGLLFTNSFSSAFLFYLARIPERWGYVRDGREILLTKTVRPQRKEPPLHQVDYYLSLLSQLGISTQAESLSLDNGWVQKKEVASLLAKHRISSKKPLIILHPGAAYGPAKRWPAAHYSRLADLLQERLDAQVAITGSNNDFLLAEEIQRPLKKKPVSFCGKTSLPLLASLIREASLFITNDTGPMHIANALKIPVVALFGPTDPRVTGPYQPPAAVLKKEVACWPCHYRQCPFDHRCLVSISPEEVLNACRQFI